MAEIIHQIIPTLLQVTFHCFANCTADSVIVTASLFF